MPSTKLSILFALCHSMLTIPIFSQEYQRLIEARFLSRITGQKPRRCGIRVHIFATTEYFFLKDVLKSGIRIMELTCNLKHTLGFALYLWGHR
jgi:hypothetical protein